MAIMFIIKQKKLNINLEIRGLEAMKTPPSQSPEQRFKQLQDKNQIKLKIGINTCCGVATCQNWRSYARNTSQNPINAAAWRSYVRSWRSYAKAKKKNPSFSCSLA